MQLVFENIFGKIFYNETDDMYLIQWLDATEELKDSDFQAFLLQFTDLIKDRNAANLFVDATKKLFVMSNDIQEWHDKVIVPRYLSSGLRKIAFHTANNDLVDISLELTFDEENSKKLQTRFFDAADLAKAWLSEVNVAV